jgi:hypothetical protein
MFTRRNLGALLAGWVFAICAIAGPFTPAQLQTVRANIEANPDLLALYNAGDRAGLAAAYNAPATPTFWVYKSSLPRHDILTGTSVDGTTFTWTGGAYITRSQGERDAFREMFNSTGAVNPAVPSIQSAFNDIFSGVGGATNRTHITAMSRRVATRMEKLFAAGAGTIANPAVLVIEGEVSPALFVDV